MAVLPIQISENRRQKLCTILWVVHWMSALCGLSLISIGLYIKIRIQDKVNLVEGYNGNSLPWMLITIGVITTVIDLAGGQLCQKVADISRRERLRALLLPYLFLFLALNVCIFVAGCMCFSHRLHLHHSFHRGLIKAMKNYKDKEAVKREINQLQVEFECCGNEGYEDWFALQWIADDYLDKTNEIVQRKMTSGGFLSDDVPYSCCRHDLLRPCIHHHVHDNQKHRNYDYREGLTLHQQGCKHALIDYFTIRLNRIGAITLVIFILQSVIFLLLRYLQTSIRNAYDADDPEGTARGWLLANVPFAKWPDLKEAEGDISVASDDSFGIDFQPEGPDWNAEEPIYENWPVGGTLDGLDGPQRAETGEQSKERKSQKKLKSGKKSKSEKKSKSDKESKSDKKSKSDERSKSEKSKPENKSGSKDTKSVGSTKKSPGSTKKSPGSTKKSPGSTKKSPGSAKKSAGTTKKSPGSTKKSPGSTKKSPGSTKKSPGSTKKSPGSTKKSPGSAKKSPGSAKKSAGSTKKSPGSAKKSAGSTKKSPGSTKTSQRSGKKVSGSTGKSPRSTKKSPGSTKKSLGSAKKSPASAKKSPRSVKTKSASTKVTSARGAKKMGGNKPRMKNRNNNIDSDHSSSSDDSSRESDCSLTPLLHGQCMPREDPLQGTGYQPTVSVPWWRRVLRKSESIYIDMGDSD
ncbi:uncharacterized protein LOC110974327 [Acanthaster planci]|uniref:Uncharacterized protein LOC110974327 n=1 Tax=Acanthaster planci TaxID=133434 RepID=A0A8B7XLA7_ACAPL|nr:uncharacterized protein LOC110974327 [Acanthaster planci]